MFIVIFHNGHWDTFSLTIKTVLTLLKQIIQLPRKLIHQRPIIPLIVISPINMLKLTNLLNPPITRYPHPLTNRLGHTQKIRILIALRNEQALITLSLEIHLNCITPHPNCHSLPNPYHQVVWQALLKKERAWAYCCHKWGVANVSNEWVCSRVLTIRENL